MRYLLLLALILGLSPLRAGGEADKFFDLATSCYPKNGALEIGLYRDLPLQYNGEQITTHSETATILIKPGDILETWSSLLFYRYKLDKLTSTRAYFTRRIYPTIREPLDNHSWSVRPGALKATEKFELDLTQPIFEFVEYTNYVEMGGKEPARTK